MNRSVKAHHNEVPGSSSAWVQPITHTLIPLTRTKEAVRALREVSLECVKTPGYDPLRPKRYDPTPFVKQGLERPDHTQDTLRRLNVIHVAGTKGKGSTCRLVSAFLESYHEQRGIPINICMLTRPHLPSCTERIQMNSKSISEEAFAATFSRVFDAVNQDPPLRLRGHRMAQLVALMAIDYAASKGVDFFICEAFCGGILDATNVFDSPAITAITKLGMDHVNLLGPSLAHIANHKAGIMRKGTICVTCVQSPDAFEVLINESRRVSAPLKAATEGQTSSVITALPKIAHRANTAIAVQVVRNLLQGGYGYQAARPFDEQDMNRGLETCRSLGSFRAISRSPHYFFLDTAHNTLSLPVALDWFDGRTSSLDQQYTSHGFTVLIYSHAAKLEGAESFKLILNSLKGEHCIDLLIITSLVGRIDGTSAAERLNLRANTCKDTLDELKMMASGKEWLTTVAVTQSVEDALKTVEYDYNPSERWLHHTSCLVTGSSFLVAEALALLETSKV